jgi:hypothetical protein
MKHNSLIKKSSLVAFSILIILFAVLFAVLGVAPQQAPNVYASGAVPTFALQRGQIINGIPLNSNDITEGRATIALVLDSPSQYVTFQYHQSSTPLNTLFHLTDSNWATFPVNGGRPHDNRTLTVDLSTVFDEQVFNAYIYFRAVDDQFTYDIVNPQPPAISYGAPGATVSEVINLAINRAQSGDFNVSRVEVLSGVHEYSAFVPAFPNWASSPLTVNVSTANPTFPANVEFLFASDFASGGTINQNAIRDEFWIPMTPVGSGSSTRYSSLIDRAMLEGELFKNQMEGQTYRGEIWIRTRDSSGNLAGGHTGTIICIDLRTPAFNVEAVVEDMDFFYANGFKPRYNFGNNEVSPFDVTYTVIPLTHQSGLESRQGSGITFSYSYGLDDLGFRWMPLPDPDSAGVFTFTVTASREGLRFRGESEAGINSVPIICETRIDKVTPRLTLSATDAMEQTIVSLGQNPPINGKAGYASDYISFITSNTAPNNSTVRIEVSIDDAAFIELNRTGLANEFIQRGPFVNRKYVFRAISQAGLYDQITFVVSCLMAEDAVLELNQAIVYPPQNTWASTAIPIFIKLPNTMNLGQSEYEFRIRYQHSLTHQSLAHTYMPSMSSSGFSVYRVYIGEGTTLNTRSLQNRVLEIFAFDLARNQTNIIQTQPINIDLVAPTATLVAGIAESGILCTSTCVCAVCGMPVFVTESGRACNTLNCATRCTVVNHTYIILANDDWANGRVEFRITPVQYAGNDVFNNVLGNISGIRLFRVVGGTLNPVDIPLVNGRFLFETTTSGIYHFALISGSGLRRDFTREIKIDLTPIAFLQMEVVRFNHALGEVSLGKTPDPSSPFIEVSRPVSSQLKIEFLSSHQTIAGQNRESHFNIFYQQRINSGNNNWTLDDTKWINGGSNGFIVIDPAQFGTAQQGVFQLRFSFYLESLAVDRNGFRSRTTQPIELIMEIDLTDFRIGLEYFEIPTGPGTTDGWTNALLAGGAFQFDITIDGYTFSSTDEITFQYNLHHAGGGESGWQTVSFGNPNVLDLIVVSPTEQYLRWMFTGVERFDPLKDPNLPVVRDPSWPPVPQGFTAAQSLGFSFNGRISVRLINEASKVSPIQSTPGFIRLDNTNPDPLNAVRRMDNSGRVNGAIRQEGNRFDIFAESAAHFQNTLLHPFYSTTYLHYAPVEYYYVAASRWASATPPTGDAYQNAGMFSSLSNASGQPLSILFDGNESYYYLFAVNTHFPDTQRSSYIRVHIRYQTDAPSASISARDGGTDANGNLLISWQEVARVEVTVHSGGIPFFLEYQIGSLSDSGWERYSPSKTGDGPFLSAGPWMFRFMGDETNPAFSGPDGFDAQGLTVILGNFDSMVHFRVVTLTGAIARFGTATHASVWIRMDDRMPHFGFDILSGSTRGSHNNAINEWLTQEANITIFPTDVSGNRLNPAQANPGGVTYEYRFDGSTEFHPIPGNGTHFSTSDIKPWAGWAGNGILHIFIRATARNDKWVELPLMLMIDSMAPNFDIGGTYLSGASWRSMESGDWIATDRASILIKLHNPNVSVVEYRYFITQDRVNPPIISDFMFWGRLQAGASSFNIDPFDSPVNTMMRIYVLAIAGDGSGRQTLKFFDLNIDNVVPIILSGGITNNYNAHRQIDFDNPNVYYIDTMITYEAVNLKFARFNNFPLPNGHIIGTNTVDNSNTGGSGDMGGFVHIVVENMAGLSAHLVFYMTVFELDINTITLSDQHRDLLDRFNNEFEAATRITGARRSLTASREAMFRSQIGRLYDRLEVLGRMVQNYRYFLDEIDSATVTLANYARMHYMINYFITLDTLIRYPQWLQDTITGEADYQRKFNSFRAKYDALHLQMQDVLRVERMVAELPSENVVVRRDYDDIRRAFDEYSTLNNSQRTMFGQALFNKLVTLRRVSELLLLTDPESGISIEGPNLAGNAALQVTEIAKTSGRVQSAQETLRQTLPPTAPRSIVYVKDFRLTDLGAQFTTGEITVHMPIPRDFQNFRFFAVYILTVEGTIMQVNNVMVDKTGESISFKTTGMNTFILAVDAVIESNPHADRIIYGKVGDIEVDGILLIYITYAVSALFVVLIAIVVFLGLRHRAFLKKYNRAYKHSLERRGIHNVPKGNPEARSNPTDAYKKMRYD